MGNSESYSRNVQVPPLLLFFRNLKPEYFSSVDRRHPTGVFMDKGSCQESFRAWLDSFSCDDDNEHMSTKCMDVSWTLLKCMETHSDYYQPILDVLLEAGKEAGEDVLRREINALVAADDNFSQEERLNRFIDRGVCKKSDEAYFGCLEEAEKNNENPFTKCWQLHKMWLKCMEAHSDYYQPLLAARKVTEEVTDRDIEALHKKFMDN